MTASPTKKICEHKIRHGKVGKDSEPTTKSEKKKQDTSNTRRFQFVCRCCCFFDLAPVSQPIWKGALCAHTHTQQTHAEFKLSKKWIQQHNNNIQHTKKNCKNKQQRDTNRHVIYIESNRKCWPRSWTYLWFVPFMWPLGRKCTDKQQLEEAAKQKQKKIITRCNSCSLKTGLGRIINLLEILILFFFFCCCCPKAISHFWFRFGCETSPLFPLCLCVHERTAFSTCNDGLMMDKQVEWFAMKCRLDVPKLECNRMFESWNQTHIERLAGIFFF